MTASSLLPPKLSENTEKPRMFRTALPACIYAKLEKESLERGVTPYKLAGLIIEGYLSGELTETGPA